MTGTQRAFILALTQRDYRALCLAKLILMHACGDGEAQTHDPRMTLWEALHWIDPSGGIGKDEAVEAIDMAIKQGCSAPGRLLLAISRADLRKLRSELAEQDGGR